MDATLPRKPERMIALLSEGQTVSWHWDRKDYEDGGVQYFLIAGQRLNSDQPAYDALWDELLITTQLDDPFVGFEETFTDEGGTVMRTYRFFLRDAK